MQDQSSKTPINATVFDSVPPVGLWALLGPSFIVASMAFRARLGAPWADVLCLFGVLVSLLYGVRTRKKPRETRVFCNIGSLQIASIGKVSARDVTGATTGLFRNRVSLMLGHKRRRNPIIVEVKDERALLAICKSLGIGHDGFGAVSLPNKKSRTEGVAYVWPFFAAVVVVLLRVDDLWSFMPVTMLVMLGLGLLAERFHNDTTMQLTGAGVYLPTSSGLAFAPFNLIERIDLTRQELCVTVTLNDAKARWSVALQPSRWSRVGASFEEIEHLVAQIRAAVDRSHGKFALRPELETARAQLQRIEGEPLRTWLARLDTLNVGAANYRGLTVDRDELWMLLEDPQADADSRAAAARVLARATPDELKIRVANVLATERDPKKRSRIAASIDDEALEEEERAEQKRLALGPFLK